MNKTGVKKMKKTHTLWEIVDWNTRDRIALVKTKNFYNSDLLNYQYGHKIISSNYELSKFDWGTYSNSTYQEDKKNCKTIDYKQEV
jgi:hypothetical protein